MKNILIAIVAIVSAGAFAADYTPVTREASAGQNAYGQILSTATSLSVATDDAITLGAYPVILVDASGSGETVSTNTLAAAASARVGAFFTIINVGASNGVLIADSAPAYNTGATLGANDSATYFVKATNVIVQVSTSNN